MYYAKTLQDLNNVEVTNWSPRDPGETEARSAWEEIPYTSFATKGVRERAAMVRELAARHGSVVLKTATLGGHARIFVTKPVKMKFTGWIETYDNGRPNCYCAKPQGWHVDGVNCGTFDTREEAVEAARREWEASVEFVPGEGTFWK